MLNKKSLKITTLAMLLVFLLTMFSGCNKTNEVELSGTIESTQIDINSEISGKVIKLEKDEGELVKAGDIVAVVDSAIQEYNVKQQEAVVKLKQAKLDDLKAGSRSEQLDQAEAAAKSAKARLDELKAGSRPEQIKQAEAAVQTASAAVEAAKTGVETANVNYNYWLDKYNKLKPLYDSKAISENDLLDTKYKVDTAKQQVLTSQDQLKSSESQLKSAEAQLELLRNGTTAQSINAAEANYEQALAQLELLRKGSTNQTIIAAEADLEQSLAALEQAKINHGKYNIKSSIEGTFLYRNINVGDIVGTGTSIGAVSDLKDLWTKVYIPQKYLQAISLNQEVTLKSAALPGKTIKGKIIFVSSEAEYTPRNTETNEAKENTVFKLKIKLLDNIENLKPGMTVDAIIPLGK